MITASSRGAEANQKGLSVRPEVLTINSVSLQRHRFVVNGEREHHLLMETAMKAECGHECPL